MLRKDGSVGVRGPEYSRSSRLDGAPRRNQGETQMLACKAEARKGIALPQWHRAAVIAAGVAAVALTVAAEARAQSPTVPPVTVGPLVQITGPSPLGGCTADDVPGQEAEDSIAFHESEIEPYIDVNPQDPDNLVTVWQQDRWSDGGARGLVSAVSDDGGATWTTVTPPRFTLCTGGTFERATDPWVTFARNGHVYFQSLSFDSDPDIFGGRHAILVSKSRDGGHTWGPVRVQIADNELNAFNDKNSMTADPTSARRAYGIWDRLELFSASAAQRAAAAAAAAATGGRDRAIAAGRALREMRLQAARSADAAVAPPEFKGPTYFTRTIDGGASWQRAFIIYDPGANNQTINNLVEVAPTGVIFAFFTEILNLPNGRVRVNIAFKRSLDHGFSFLPTSGRTIAHRIFTLAIDNAFGTFTPDEGEPVREAGILFDSAVDPRTGALYLAWQDSRFSGGLIDEIAFSMSTDSGQTWTAPVKINKTPVRSNPFRQAAFLPAIAVNQDGVLAVTYYDFRRDNNSGELTDQFALFCNPATSNCGIAASWGRERRLTTSSFDILDAPVAGGHFLGDYMGLESVSRVFHPAFGIADGADETSLFTRRIGVAPVVVTTASAD